MSILDDKVRTLNLAKIVRALKRFSDFAEFLDYDAESNAMTQEKLMEKDFEIRSRLRIDPGNLELQEELEPETTEYFGNSFLDTILTTDLQSEILMLGYTLLVGQENNYTGGIFKDATEGDASAEIHTIIQDSIREVVMSQRPNIKSRVNIGELNLEISEIGFLKKGDRFIGIYADSASEEGNRHGIYLVNGLGELFYVGGKAGLVDPHIREYFRETDREFKAFLDSQ